MLQRTHALLRVTTLKPQFEVSPQTRRIGNGAWGVGKIMMRRNGNLVQALLALRSRSAGYHPERHYMRGPGPKTLSKLGEMYREETKDLLRERLPDGWVALIRSIEEPDGDR